MLIDTHCHVNMLVKSEFDIPLTPEMIEKAEPIIAAAQAVDVDRIINVGTSVVESKNCITLAKRYDRMWAVIGIHPNDCTAEWQNDIKVLEALLSGPDSSLIVGIGECGIDRHYPGHNLQRQVDVFRAQIELALEHDRAVVVHSRDAYDETLRVLEEYVKHEPRTVMHCFSYDRMFADQVLSWGFSLGIGGAVTYPKNEELRSIVEGMDLKRLLLETDSPFLPPQSIRGKRNTPASIRIIADFITSIRPESYEVIAQTTTRNAYRMFGIE